MEETSPDARRSRPTPHSAQQRGRSFTRTSSIFYASSPPPVSSHRRVSFSSSTSSSSLSLTEFAERVANAAVGATPLWSFSSSYQSSARTQTPFSAPGVSASSSSRAFPSSRFASSEGRAGREEGSGLPSQVPPSYSSDFLFVRGEQRRRDKQQLRWQAKFNRCCWIPQDDDGSGCLITQRNRLPDGRGKRSFAPSQRPPPPLGSRERVEGGSGSAADVSSFSGRSRGAAFVAEETSGAKGPEENGGEETDRRRRKGEEREEEAGRGEAEGREKGRRQGRDDERDEEAETRGGGGEGENEGVEDEEEEEEEGAREDRKSRETSETREGGGEDSGGGRRGRRRSGDDGEDSPETTLREDEVDLGGGYGRARGSLQNEETGETESKKGQKGALADPKETSCATPVPQASSASLTHPHKGLLNSSPSTSPSCATAATATPSPSSSLPTACYSSDEPKILSSSGSSPWLKSRDSPCLSLSTTPSLICPPSPPRPPESTQSSPPVEREEKTRCKPAATSPSVGPSACDATPLETRKGPKPSCSSMLREATRVAFASYDSLLARELGCDPLQSGRQGGGGMNRLRMPPAMRSSRRVLMTTWRIPTPLSAREHQASATLLAGDGPRGGGNSAAARGIPILPSLITQATALFTRAATARGRTSPSPAPHRLQGGETVPGSGGRSVATLRSGETGAEGRRGMGEGSVAELSGRMTSSSQSSISSRHGLRRVEGDERGGEVDDPSGSRRTHRDEEEGGGGDSELRTPDTSSSSSSRSSRGAGDQPAGGVLTFRLVDSASPLRSSSTGGEMFLGSQHERFRRVLGSMVGTSIGNGEDSFTWRSEEGAAQVLIPRIQIPLISSLDPGGEDSLHRQLLRQSELLLLLGLQEIRRIRLRHTALPPTTVRQPLGEREGGRENLLQRRPAGALVPRLAIAAARAFGGRERGGELRGTRGAFLPLTSRTIGGSGHTYRGSDSGGASRRRLQVEGGAQVDDGEGEPGGEETQERSESRREGRTRREGPVDSGNGAMDVPSVRRRGRRTQEEEEERTRRLTQGAERRGEGGGEREGNAEKDKDGSDAHETLGATDKACEFEGGPNALFRRVESAMARVKRKTLEMDLTIHDFLLLSLQVAFERFSLPLPEDFDTLRSLPRQGERREAHQGGTEGPGGEEARRAVEDSTEDQLRPTTWRRGGEGGGGGGEEEEEMAEKEHGTFVPCEDKQKRRKVVFRLLNSRLSTRRKPGVAGESTTPLVLSSPDTPDPVMETAISGRSPLLRPSLSSRPPPSSSRPAPYSSSPCSSSSASPPSYGACRSSFSPPPPPSRLSRTSEWPFLARDGEVGSRPHSSASCPSLSSYGQTGTASGPRASLRGEEPQEMRKPKDVDEKAPHTFASLDSSCPQRCLQCDQKATECPCRRFVPRRVLLAKNEPTLALVLLLLLEASPSGRLTMADVDALVFLPRGLIRCGTPKQRSFSRLPSDGCPLLSSPLLVATPQKPMPLCLSSILQGSKAQKGGKTIHKTVLPQHIHAREGGGGGRGFSSPGVVNSRGEGESTRGLRRDSDEAYDRGSSPSLRSSARRLATTGGGGGESRRRALPSLREGGSRLPVVGADTQSRGGGDSGGTGVSSAGGVGAQAVGEVGERLRRERSLSANCTAYTEAPDFSTRSKLSVVARGGSHGTLERGVSVGKGSVGCHGGGSSSLETNTRPVKIATRVEELCTSLLERHFRAVPDKEMAHAAATIVSLDQRYRQGFQAGFVALSEERVLLTCVDREGLKAKLEGYFGISLSSYLDAFLGESKKEGSDAEAFTRIPEGPKESGVRLRRELSPHNNIEEEKRRTRHSVGEEEEISRGQDGKREGGNQLELLNGRKRDDVLHREEEESGGNKKAQGGTGRVCETWSRVHLRQVLSRLLKQLRGAEGATQKETFCSSSRQRSDTEGRDEQAMEERRTSGENKRKRCDEEEEEEEESGEARSTSQLFFQSGGKGEDSPLWSSSSLPLLAARNRSAPSKEEKVEGREEEDEEAEGQEARKRNQEDKTGPWPSWISRIVRCTPISLREWTREGAEAKRRKTGEKTFLSTSRSCSSSSSTSSSFIEALRSAGYRAGLRTTLFSSSSFSQLTFSPRLADQVDCVSQVRGPIIKDGIASPAQKQRNDSDAFGKKKTGAPLPSPSPLSPAARRSPRSSTCAQRNQLVFSSSTIRDPGSPTGERKTEKCLDTGGKKRLTSDRPRRLLRDSPPLSASASLCLSPPRPPALAVVDRGRMAYKALLQHFREEYHTQLQRESVMTNGVTAHECAAGSPSQPGLPFGLTSSACSFSSSSFSPSPGSLHATSSLSPSLPRVTPYPSLVVREGSAQAHRQVLAQPRTSSCPSSSRSLAAGGREDGPDRFDVREGEGRVAHAGVPIAVDCRRVSERGDRGRRHRQDDLSFSASGFPGDLMTPPRGTPQPPQACPLETSEEGSLTATSPTTTPATPATPGRGRGLSSLLSSFVSPGLRRVFSSGVFWRSGNSQHRQQHAVPLDDAHPHAQRRFSRGVEMNAQEESCFLLSSSRATVSSERGERGREEENRGRSGAHVVRFFSSGRDSSLSGRPRKSVSSSGMPLESSAAAPRTAGASSSEVSKSLPPHSSSQPDNGGGRGSATARSPLSPGAGEGGGDARGRKHEDFSSARRRRRRDSLERGSALPSGGGAGGNVGREGRRELGGMSSAFFCDNSFAGAGGGQEGGGGQCVGEEHRLGEGRDAGEAENQMGTTEEVEERPTEGEEEEEERIGGGQQEEETSAQQEIVEAEGEGERESLRSRVRRFLASLTTAATDRDEGARDASSEGERSADDTWRPIRRRRRSARIRRRTEREARWLWRGAQRRGRRVEGGEEEDEAREEETLGPEEDLTLLGGEGRRRRRRASPLFDGGDTTHSEAAEGAEDEGGENFRWETRRRRAGGRRRRRRGRYLWREGLSDHSDDRVGAGASSEEPDLADTSSEEAEDGALVLHHTANYRLYTDQEEGESDSSASRSSDLSD